MTRVFCHCIYGIVQVYSGVHPGVQLKRVLFWGKALRKEKQGPFSCYLTDTFLSCNFTPRHRSLYISLFHSARWSYQELFLPLICSVSFSHTCTQMLFHLLGLCSERTALIQPHPVYLLHWSYLTSHLKG